MVLYTLNGEEVFKLELLDYLCHNNNIEVRRMLDEVDPKNLSDSHGMTLLHHAVIYNNVEIAQYLIDRGCDVNALNNRGITPLSFAVIMQGLSIIKVLLAANADILLGNKCKQSPVEAVLASDSSHVMDIIMMFLERVKRDSLGDSVATAKALLNINCPLSRALLLRDTAITRYMLENGASVHEVDYSDNTALHCAVWSADLEHVKLLIEWGADVNAVNGSMQMPLDLYHLQRVTDHQILRTLLDHGASLDLYHPQRDTDHQILRTLLDHGAFLDVQDDSGYMTVTRMFANGDRETVKILLEYNVDLHATNADGTSLLHHAAYNENPGVIELLQGRNFDVNARNVNGETALSYAAEVANPELLKFLLDNGADTSNTDHYGDTAFLHGFNVWVAKKNKLQNCLRCIELFLKYGAVFDYVDAYRETILDYALASDSFVLTKPIIEYVAMGEEIGKPVATNEMFLSQIISHEKFRSHFEFCKVKIKKMKRVVIFENVTLFKFLKDDERKLEKYARNQKLVEKLTSVIYCMRRSNLYFVKILRTRIDKAIKTAKLREEAAIGLSKIEGLDNNDHVIEKILSFFNDVDLRNIGLI